MRPRRRQWPPRERRRSADGTRLAVGAPYAGSVALSGQARVFEYTGAAWTQLGASISGRAMLDLAVSVALSSDGGRLAVGERGHDGNGQDSGDTRVFEYDGAAWTQLGSDIDGEAAGDESGASVALSADGGRLAVGAPRNDGNGAESGHARVYDVCSTSFSRRLTEKVHGPVTRAFYSWTQRQFATP